VVLSGLVVAGAFLWWACPDRITQENYVRVTKATTRTEVEAILGKGTPTTMQGSSPGETTLCWEGDAGDVEVTFDASGYKKSWSYPQPIILPEDELGRLFLRFQHQWHRWFP
jgi:hypothetical protein